MRGFDMTPLLRTTVGFDRLARTLDTLAAEQVPTYPPYNIEKLDEDSYTITMAVAGFSEDDLEITVQENQLTVKGKISVPEDAVERQFLHRGIAERAFERQFSLADHIKVGDASMQNGLLHISLKREVPEEAKPRQIAITTANGNNRKAIEKKAA
ncbi:MAG: Hsp20 family protein [Alphaproteobacteria bacterium]|nr:Hsp20 family protein [Alphaproteobacteria bacterium]